MSNVPPFLDTSSASHTSSGAAPSPITANMTNSIPRAAPSPAPSNSSVQSNGIVGGGQSNIPLVNGLPSGGQQTDMHHLWNVIQQLSEVLAENRAQTQGIFRGMEGLRERGFSLPGSDEGGAVREVNGDDSNATQAAQIAHLQSQLSHSQSENDALRTTLSSTQNLLTDYEDSLSHILSKLRPFAYTHSQTLISLHAHYNSLLEAERQTNLELRLEHADWQAGLSRANEYARLALREQSGVGMGYERRLREVRGENRTLRRLAGWEVEDSDEEGEGQQEGGLGGKEGEERDGSQSAIVLR